MVKQTVIGTGHIVAGRNIEAGGSIAATGDIKSGGAKESGSFSRDGKSVLIIAADEQGAAAQQLKVELEKLFKDQQITCLYIEGNNWRDAVKQGIAAAGVVLFFLGSKSSAESWSSFVAGMADAKELPTFPLIHSGVTPQTLPAYCATMEAVEILKGEGFKKLCLRLASEFGITSELPTLDWEVPAAWIAKRL